MLTTLTLIAGLMLSAPPADEMPRYWDQYPKKDVATLFDACLEAGSKYKFDPEKVEGFCTCHVFMIIETVPFQRFLELEKSNSLGPLFNHATKECAKIGFSLEKLREPKVDKENIGI